MAVAVTANPFADVHGKLNKTDRTIYRVRDGILQAYSVKHPYHGKPTAAQKQQRTSFKSLNAQVKAIYDDPEQKALWQARFEAFISTRQYKKQLQQYIAEKRAPSRIPAIFVPQSVRTPKPPTTLYGFILSSLAKQDQNPA